MLGVLKTSYKMTLDISDLRCRDIPGLNNLTYIIYMSDYLLYQLARHSIPWAYGGGKGTRLYCEVLKTG